MIIFECVLKVARGLGAISAVLSCSVFSPREETAGAFPGHRLVIEAQCTENALSRDFVWSRAGEDSGAKIGARAKNEKEAD